MKECKQGCSLQLFTRAVRTGNKDKSFSFQKIHSAYHRPLQPPKTRLATSNVPPEHSGRLSPHRSLLSKQLPNSLFRDPTGVIETALVFRAPMKTSQKRATSKCRSPRFPFRLESICMASLELNPQPALQIDRLQKHISGPSNPSERTSRQEHVHSLERFGKLGDAIAGFVNGCVHQPELLKVRKRRNERERIGPSNSLSLVAGVHANDSQPANRGAKVHMLHQLRKPRYGHRQPGCLWP